jgi:uncharacterized NAD(P)/FAD-binding protein YdhS
MNPSDQLRNWARACREMPHLARASVPAVRDAVEQVVKGTAAAGETPDGARWPLTEEGEAALKEAAARVTVETRGNVVLTSVEGHTALHHLDVNGAAVKRQVIPEVLTPQLEQAIGAVLTRQFEAVVNGR